VIIGVFYIITAVAVLYALWTLSYLVRNKTPREPHVIGAGVVEAVLLVQAAIAIVLWIVDDGPIGNGVTFVGYLLFTLLLLPVALFLALAEKSRWGTAILFFGALLVPVLTLRLQQVWDGV
jgi:hypothetical protein